MLASAEMWYSHCPMTNKYVDLDGDNHTPTATIANAKNAVMEIPNKYRAGFLEICSSLLCPISGDSRRA